MYPTYDILIVTVAILRLVAIDVCVYTAYIYIYIYMCVDTHIIDKHICISNYL